MGLLSQGSAWGRAVVGMLPEGLSGGRATIQSGEHGLHRPRTSRPGGKSLAHERHSCKADVARVLMSRGTLAWAQREAKLHQGPGLRRGQGSPEAGASTHPLRPGGSSSQDW